MSKYSVETSFLGHRIPKEVKLLVKALKGAKSDIYSPQIDAVVDFIVRGNAPDFGKDLDCSPSRVLFGGFYSILHRALRHASTLLEVHFVGSLKEVGLSDEVITGLGNVLYRGELQSLLRVPVEPSRFKDVDWRLDVILSNQSLAKVLQPEVLLGLKLAGGEEITLHLSQTEFHALRQSVAKQLHDMCQLKERKFMKLNSA